MGSITWQPQNTLGGGRALLAGCVRWTWIIVWIQVLEVVDITFGRGNLPCRNGPNRGLFCHVTCWRVSESCFITLVYYTNSV